MIGATGAVGSACARALMARHDLGRLTTLGRRLVAGLTGDRVVQHVVNIGETTAYRALLPGHTAAICTLGVGQPSAVSREEFIRIDKNAVLAFARAAKDAGIRHFELLSSVGVDSRSRSFYLRTKGELVDELRRLQFSRLSVFCPSMILTPSNRYGLVQGVTLAVWPLLQPVLVGRLRKFRGVQVEVLGRALAQHAGAPGAGDEAFYWDDFIDLHSRTSSTRS
jgi:uncharacterized protein YbjT (DUF2867 family)